MRCMAIGPDGKRCVNKRTLGIVSTLVGASLWGVSGTCVQYLLANYAISSLFIAMMRTVGAGLIFLVVLLVRNRAAVAEMLGDKRALARLVAFGVCGLYLSQATYIITIGYTNAGTATVLQSTSIVMIMLVTCALTPRFPRPRELAGLVLAFVATVLIATQGDLGELNIPFRGLVWGMISALTAVAYSMVPRPLYPRWGSFAVVGLGMLAGGIAATALWALAFAFPQIDALVSAGSLQGTALLPVLDGTGVAVLATVIVLGTFAAFFLFLNGIAMIGAVQGSQLGAIEPVSATVCSALVMGTAFSAADWIGLALMVGTIVIVASGSASPDIQSANANSSEKER